MSYHRGHRGDEHREHRAALAAGRAGRAVFVLILWVTCLASWAQGNLPAAKTTTVSVDPNTGAVVAPAGFWASNSNGIAAVLPPGNGGGQTVSVNGSAVANPNLIDSATALLRATLGNVTVYPTNLADAQISANALIALTKLAQIGNGTVLGNSSGGNATPSALTTLPAGVQGNITQVGTLASGNIPATLITSGSLNSARIPTGVGVTNGGGVISANLAAGANVTITTGANGQQTIAASASGGTVTVSEQDGAPSVAANTIKFNNGTVTDNGGGVVSVSNSASGGDFSSNTSTSVDGEVVVFSGTGGKTGKRATGTGIAKLTSGVLGTATAGTDYAPATSGSAILKGNGAGGFSNAASGTDYAPATSGSAILKGNGAGGFSSAVAGTDYLLPSYAPQTITISGGLAATDASLFPQAVRGTYRIAANANFTLSNPTNPTDGQTIVYEITQDATGSRVMTLGTKFQLATPPGDITSATLSTAANATDFMTATYRLNVDKWRITSIAHGY